MPGDGLRIRTTLRTLESSFWADVNYNTIADPDVLNTEAPGFWLWNSDASATYAHIFHGSSSTEHVGKAISIGVDYFVELNRDDGSAVLTVRTGSFSGPILLAHGDKGLTAAQNTGEFLKLSTASGVAGVTFKDIRVDRYALP